MTGRELIIPFATIKAKSCSGSRQKRDFQIEDQTGIKKKGGEGGGGGGGGQDVSISSTKKK